MLWAKIPWFKAFVVMQNPVIQRIKRRAEVCQSLPVTCGRRGNDTGNGMVTVGSIQCAVDCFPENGKSPHSKPFTFLLLPAAKCRSGMFFTLPTPHARIADNNEKSGSVALPPLRSDRNRITPSGEPASRSTPPPRAPAGRDR